MPDSCTGEKKQGIASEARCTEQPEPPKIKPVSPSNWTRFFGNLPSLESPTTIFTVDNVLTTKRVWATVFPFPFEALGILSVVRVLDASNWPPHSSFPKVTGQFQLGGRNRTGLVGHMLGVTFGWSSTS